MERDDATRAHLLRDEPQGSGRVAHVHEHEPSDRGIKESPAIDRTSIRARNDVGDPQRGAPVVRQADCIAVEIDADHRALGADELAHQKADVTRPAADVEHMHASADAGRAQQPFGERPEQVGLLDQSVVFGVRPAQRVVGIVHRSCLASQAFL